MDYEKLASGLIVPKTVPKKTNTFRMLSRKTSLRGFANTMMVAIQLATVWILWKTYQDTVIPNRQKELLAEQVAQLEIERGTLATSIASTKRRAEAYDKELRERRSELSALAGQRNRLLVEAREAEEQERVAKASEESARFAALTAQGDLESSQWSIYFLSAASIVNVPSIKTGAREMRLDLGRIGADDPLEAFHAYLDGVDAAWPRLDADAEFVSQALLSDRSDQYPNWMTEEFATYFRRETGRLNCQKPDFSSIRLGVDAKYRRAPDDSAYKVLDDERKEVRGLIDRCYAEFEKVGDLFFVGKGAKQQVIPKVMVDALNETLGGSK